MPPSASSNRPTRSVFASVNAPLTWPNSSLSKTPSDRPPAFTVTRPLPARADTAWIACATVPLPVPFSPVTSTFASDGPTRCDQLEHRPHRRRFGDQHRPDVRLERSVFGFEPLLAAQRPRQLDLRAEDGQQPRVLPRLLHEVARAAAHRFDRHFDAAPRRHHDDRQRRIVRAAAATAGRALPGPTSCRARSSDPSARRRIRRASIASRIAAGEPAESIL